MIFLGIILLILPKQLKKKNIYVVRDFKIIEIDFFTTKLIKSLIVKFNAQFGQLLNAVKIYLDIITFNLPYTMGMLFKRQPTFWLF